MPYFNSQHLPSPSAEYVAWIDVMGTQASMSRSIRTTANFIGKLHSAALESRKAGVHLYPVMDGVYAASPDRTVFFDFLRVMLHSLAREFVMNTGPQYRFLVRGGVAFGAVYHGDQIKSRASKTLAADPAYRKSLLLGMPMVQAFKAESSAPPFGIAVDESARGFSPLGSEPLHSAWWHWKNTATAADWDALTPAMADYFNWYKERSVPLGYPADRIDAHSAMYAQLVALAT